MSRNALWFLAFISALALARVDAGELQREDSSSQEIANVDDEDDEDFSDEVQLELAKIRLVLEKGHYQEGLNRLETLSQSYPDNMDLLLMKASAQSQVGQWISALSSVETVLKEESDNQEALNLRKDILKEHRGFMSIKAEYKKTGSLRKESFAFLKGKVKLAQWTYLHFDLQNDYIDAKNMTRPRTGEDTARKANRTQGDVSLEHYFNDTHSVKGGIYGARAIVGGHASYTLQDSKGYTTVGGRLRRPDWDYSETVVFNGSQDSAFLRRLLKFSEAFEVSLEGGVNNYHVDKIDNVAQTGFALGRAAYTFSNKEGYAYLPGKNSSIVLSYAFDGEYPYRVKNRANSKGEGYPVLGVTRSENHNFELSLSTFLTAALEVSAYGGYTFTRFAKNSPFAGANLDYTIKEKIKLGLEYGHTVDTVNRTQNVDRFRAKVTYLFE